MTGKGRNWIFLRGLSRGRGHWGDFVEKFQARFPEDRIELLDLPGNGERNKEPSPLAIIDYVRDLRAQSDLIKEGKPVHLLALSLGGMIAIEWAQRYSDDVARLVTVCSSASNYSPPWERFRVSNYPRLLKMAASQGALEFERNILSLISNNHERQELLLSRLVDYSDRNPVSVENTLRQLVAASRFRLPQTPRVPTQMIGSWGDRLVAPECTMKMAASWGLQAEMHPWSGHDLPIDDPDWLLDRLLDRPESL